MRFLKQITFAFIILSFALATQSFAQKEKEKNKKVNFGYSANPPAKKAKKKIAKNTKKSKSDDSENNSTSVKNETSADSVKKESKEVKAVNATTAENKETTDPENVETKNETNVSIANKTREIAKKASRANIPPTEIYKVGVGDVLYINLQNTTAKYYTVLIDGTIDYPLAGKLVSVIDLTTDEIEDLLREKVKLYENPQVTVKVREYVSHKFSVKGLARSGEHFLQREAMPLLVVKTMVGVNSDVKQVIIERENNEPKTLSLEDDEVNKFLVQSGDVLTFVKEQNEQKNSSESSTIAYYFLDKKICDGGKKKFHKGITLVQAVFDACGGINEKLKEVTIIRKTKSGKFVSKTYNYRDILKGKEVDPKLQADDLVDAEK